MENKYNFTKMETKILNLILDGLSVEEIEAETDMVNRTIYYHIRNIGKKLGTKTQTKWFRILGTWKPNKDFTPTEKEIEVCRTCKKIAEFIKQVQLLPETGTVITLKANANKAKLQENWDKGLCSCCRNKRPLSLVATGNGNFKVMMCNGCKQRLDKVREEAVDRELDDERIDELAKLVLVSYD